MRAGRVWSSLIALALLSPWGTAALAQDAKQKQDKERDVIVQQEQIVVQGGEPFELPLPPLRQPSGGTFVFLSSEMSFGGKLVKGAPYSAEAVTETVQSLADGNRIVRKSTAQVYRDSEGRTRREQTLGNLGPFAPAGEAPQTIFINDPVAGVNYILDPRERTARKLPLPRFRVRGKPGEVPAGTGQNGPARRRVQVETEMRTRVGGPGDVFTVVTPPTPPPGADFAAGVIAAQGAGFNHSFERKPADVKKESLGKRSFDGVEAEGTRHTHTIPAGEIGNEQPINVVSETWYSPELQTVVMTRHSDPRFGETTYRLTNISRSEPAATLFQLPSDYTVKEGPSVRTFMTPKPKEDK
ncbi:MAG TPA: hypothetical protein VGV38_18535 [Pyrinomonadaceae bacterium]|nr:hypothetical protein [Pyrinomonadaceae bacterium]